MNKPRFLATLLGGTQLASCFLTWVFLQFLQQSQMTTRFREYKK